MWKHMLTSSKRVGPAAALFFNFYFSMVGAVIYHFQRKELSLVIPSAVLLLLSVIVLVGRWLVVPF